jgi:hypothetical protein
MINNERILIVSNNMKLILATFGLLLLAGCATNDYATYVDAQKSLSKDNTISETARLAALTEMSKSSDSAVRTTGIMLLQQLQQNNKAVVIEPPKKNWLGF